MNKSTPGRPKVHNFNDEQLLALVCAHAASDLAAITLQLVKLRKEWNAERDNRVWQEICRLEKKRDLPAGGWTRYVVAELLGREPTDSERVILSRTFRRLAHEGLVEIAKPLIRLTDAGRRRVACNTKHEDD